jgi:glycosyltransferase involved in cell wall biosynthesis
MKIIYIIPGFGGTYYCGNCLRDSVFSKAMKANGHDAVTLPLYLPHSIKDFAHQAEVPVFYGAVNIYLKQHFKVFRHMPRWLHSFFNSPFLLKYAAKKSGSTRAEGLEEMTISMLNGAEGFQHEELNELIDYIRHHEKPDVVHLSNALLMGLAKKIKEELRVPVFCSLQDEDVWINAMKESYKPKLWQLMSNKVKDIDAFIAVSHYFKKVMQNNMQIPDSKIFAVPIGVDPDLYTAHLPASNPQAIGYLSRMNEENGFGILIDAFIKLKKNPEFSSTRLILTGGKTDDDKPYISKQIKKLERQNIIDYVEFIEFGDKCSTSNMESFFDKISILSVPVVNGEAFGLYLLEAMASGIPVVQPALGAFPEIVKASNGGAIYSPNSADALCEKWQEVLQDTSRLDSLSHNSRKAVEEIFNLHRTTAQLVEIYRKFEDSKI